MLRAFWRRFGNPLSLLWLLVEILVLTIVWAATQIFEDAFVTWVKHLYATQGSGWMGTCLSWYSDNPAMGIIVICVLTMMLLWFIAFVDDRLLARRASGTAEPPVPRTRNLSAAILRQLDAEAPARRMEAVAKPGFYERVMGPQLDKAKAETILHEKRKAKAEADAAEEQLRQTRTAQAVQSAEPRVEAVGGKLCWVVEYNGGCAEWDTQNLVPERFGDTLRALVATFRHEGGPRVKAARVRIDYVDRSAKVVENVDYGCWLGEQTNSADFDYGDTKHVVIALVDERQAFVVNDPRRDASQSKGHTARPLPLDTIRAYVTLLLLDGDYQPLAQPVKSVFDLTLGKKPAIALVTGDESR